MSVGNKSRWSRDQDKAFENALAIYPEVSPDRWEKIAADVGGKTLEEIKLHYECLVDDVNRIELGCVPLPSYAHAGGGGGGGGNKRNSKFGHNKRKSFLMRSDLQERRKGSPWTEEEHRLFLAGLDEYGKGDWRSISQNYVVTKTPTQVASHAQKYFIRFNSMNNKERRRSSIHDITRVGNGDDISAPQGPITGQLNGGAARFSSGKSGQLSPQHPAALVGVAMYGAGGPFVSVVGTPMNLPHPAQVDYGVRAPGEPKKKKSTFQFDPTKGRHNQE